MEAVPIREIRTKSDFMFIGDMIHISLSPCCKGGLIIEFTRDTDKVPPSGMPEFLLDLAKIKAMADGSYQEIIVKTSVHPKWYHKIFRVSIQTLVKRRINTVKNEFLRVQKNNELAKELEASI